MRHQPDYRREKLAASGRAGVETRQALRLSLFSPRQDADHGRYDVYGRACDGDLNRAPNSSWTVRMSEQRQRPTSGLPRPSGNPDCGIAAAHGAVSVEL